MKTQYKTNLKNVATYPNIVTINTLIVELVNRISNTGKLYLSGNSTQDLYKNSSP